MLIENLIHNSYLQHFAHSPSTVATFALLSTLSVLVALLCPRRRLVLLTLGVSASAVAALTLVPAGGWTTFTVVADPATAVREALRPHWSDLAAWRVADGPANVALFVPLSFFLGLLLRRPAAAAVLAALLSVGIESFQAATGTRVGSFADVVSNSIGAGLGAAAAGLVVTLLTAVHPTQRLQPSQAPNG